MTLKVEYEFYSDGTFDKIWRNEKGELHREDGPALECANGKKSWYKNRLWHREDGPAIVWHDGTHLYFLNDKQYSKKEYWEVIKRLKKEKKGRK